MFSAVFEDYFCAAILRRSRMVSSSFFHVTAQMSVAMMQAAVKSQNVAFQPRDECPAIWPTTIFESRASPSR